MLATVIDPLTAPLSVTGFGIYDGAPHDASIRFHEPHDEENFTIRTTLRTGERMKGGRPSGVMNDASSLRSSAAVSLALEAIPARLSREERIAAVEAAYADAAAASEGNDWSFTPASLNENEYVLWYRSYKGGFIAHADMGAFVIAAWGRAQSTARTRTTRTYRNQRSD